MKCDPVRKNDRNRKKKERSCRRTFCPINRVLSAFLPSRRYKARVQSNPINIGVPHFSLGVAVFQLVFPRLGHFLFFFYHLSRAFQSVCTYVPPSLLPLCPRKIGGAAGYRIYRRHRKKEENFKRKKRNRKCERRARKRREPWDLHGVFLCFIESKYTNKAGHRMIPCRRSFVRHHDRAYTATASV